MNDQTRNSGRRGFGRSKTSPLDAELAALMNFVGANNYSEAERLARRILGRRPQQPFATKALSFALLGTGRYSEALAVLDEAVRRFPLDAELKNNHGIALSGLGRSSDAIASFEHALTLTPDDPELLKNLAGAWLSVEKWERAIPLLLKAIEKHPGDYVDAIELLAVALVGTRRFDEASVCYQELFGADESNLRALFQLIACNLKRCMWDGLSENLATLRARSNDFRLPLQNPFTALAFPGFGGHESRRNSESWCQENLAVELAEVASYVPVFERQPEKAKLRIAYISGDLRDHPVGWIIPEVIECHDRRRVDVWGYSTTADDGSESRRRLASGFDTLVDLTDVPPNEIAKRIRDDQIDVLIDLNGWTEHGRPKALAMRCAPIQVNWLGYAGTMGHERVADYLLGDPVTTPIDHAPFFTETIAQLPACYLPVDTAQMPAGTISRRDAGLPDSAFVFCSLNSSYKYNPQVFDSWAEIMRRAPDSVLWLTDPGENAANRLRLEIEKRSVSKDRLIFAPRVASHGDHLGRLPLADLALDTFPYNSHSTGMDMLWAGVPMVALLGDFFPSRVAASMLMTASLPELVVDSQKEYIELALELYSNREKLAGIRRRLHDARSGGRLFDMARFARDLEDIYFQMWQQFCAGRRTAILAQP